MIHLQRNKREKELNKKKEDVKVNEANKWNNNAILRMVYEM